MAIYVGKNNAALLKSDKTAVELYKGDKKILGYSSSKGEIINENDVHPVEHKLKISLSSKNLIKYPYADTTKTVNGITFTDNGDGTVTANGTATANADFSLSSWMEIKKGMFLSSGTQSDSVYTYEIFVNGLDGTLLRSRDNQNYADHDFVANMIRIRVRPGAVVKDLLFKPQIEFGTQATPYTKYVADYSKVNVTRCSKNLIPYPYYATTGESNGITFTDNGDGSITINGTAIATANFMFSKENQFFLPPGRYCISNGNPEAKGYMLLGTLDSEWTNQITGNITFVKSVYGTVGNFLYQIPKGNTFNNVTIYPQLEYGEAQTDYEPYKFKKSVAKADGTVEGLTSLAPNMNVFTDTAGIVVNCSYLKS